MTKPTHCPSGSRGLVAIADMHSEHAYNSADKLEREGAADEILANGFYRSETVNALRGHANMAYDAWASENPAEAAEAADKRVAKGLAPRGTVAHG